MGVLNDVNKMLKPMSRVLGYAPQFTEYVSELQANDYVYVYVPLSVEDRFKVDVQALIERLGGGGFNVVYVDSPNNPTGQVIDLRELRDLVEEAGGGAYW